VIGRELFGRLSTRVIYEKEKKLSLIAEGPLLALSDMQALKTGFYEKDKLFFEFDFSELNLQGGKITVVIVDEGKKIYPVEGCEE
jgi:hypothetical protein